MMYESPIEIIQRDIANGIQIKMENDICNAICSYGINVNREELIKALAYDRQQYEKGFQDARTKLKPMCKYLTKCMSHPETDRNYYDWCGLYREDCNCQCCYR